jgi:hypothetical protein
MAWACTECPWGPQTPTKPECVNCIHRTQEGEKTEGKGEKS